MPKQSAQRVPLIWWLAATTLLATAAIIISDDGLALFRQDHSYWGWMKIAAIGVTGVLAVLAATRLANIGRSRTWIWIPLPVLLIWIGSCIADGRGRAISNVQTVEWSLLTGLNSTIFILAVSAPLVATLTKVMILTPRHWPTSTTLYTGLGAAAISVFVMQFFQLHTPNIIDFALRITAILIVMGGTSLFAQLCAADPPELSMSPRGAEIHK